MHCILYALTVQCLWAAILSIIVHRCFVHHHMWLTPVGSHSYVWSSCNHWFDVSPSNLSVSPPVCRLCFWKPADESTARGCCGSEANITSLWKIHEAINSYCGLAQASLSDRPKCIMLQPKASWLEGWKGQIDATLRCSWLHRLTFFRPEVTVAMRKLFSTLNLARIWVLHWCPIRHGFISLEERQFS